MSAPDPLREALTALLGQASEDATFDGGYPTVGYDSLRRLLDAHPAPKVVTLTEAERADLLAVARGAYPTADGVADPEGWAYQVTEYMAEAVERIIAARQAPPLAHGMIPGTHEWPRTPECRCGQSWDRQAVAWLRARAERIEGKK